MRARRRNMRSTATPAAKTKSSCGASRSTCGPTRSEMGRTARSTCGRVAGARRLLAASFRSPRSGSDSSSFSTSFIHCRSRCSTSSVPGRIPGSGRPWPQVLNSHRSRARLLPLDRPRSGFPRCARSLTTSPPRPRTTRRGAGSCACLPQPLYRYESTDPDVLDGAVFGFVTSAGTDLEALVVIEARKPSPHRWPCLALCDRSVHGCGDLGAAQGQGGF